MILLIDNYDSFSYNLYQLIGEIDKDIRVIRNDEMTVSEIEKLSPAHIIISPGPGKPRDSGICEESIRYFAGKVSILGVCLGHQAICEAFGMEVTYAKKLMHGKQSMVSVDTSCDIFKGMGDAIQAARYHSLSANEETLPKCLLVTARSDDGEIMGVRHKEFDIFGVQFHPESILTPKGKMIMENFLGGKRDD